MSNQLMLGVIQMTVDENKEVALEKAMRNIVFLAEKGANMIVLPEMFNCPYETIRFKDYAEEAGGRTCKLLSQAAKTNGVYIIGGSIPEFEEGRLYNTSFIYNPEGDLIGKHRKMHLFDIDIQNGQYFKESEVLSPGNSPTIIDTIYGKIGVAICYDVRFPELARLMSESGAKLLIYPAAFNMTTGPAHWELLFRSRAVDQQVFVVACAPARDYNAPYISYGNSMIVNPWGEMIGRLHDEEGYLLGEINLDEVNHVRHQMPLNHHLRKDVYAIEDLSAFDFKDVTSKDKE